MIVWTRVGCSRSRGRTPSSSGESWCAVVPPVALTQCQPNGSLPCPLLRATPVQSRKGGYPTVRLQRVAGSHAGSETKQSWRDRNAPRCAFVRPSGQSGPSWRRILRGRARRKGIRPRAAECNSSAFAAHTSCSDRCLYSADEHARCRRSRCCMCRSTELRLATRRVVLPQCVRCYRGFRRWNGFCSGTTRRCRCGNLAC